MTTENATIPKNPRALWAAGGAKASAAPRASLRLTAPERKWLLLGWDLVLVNGALLGAAVMWNEFAVGGFAVAAHLKWFLTLTVLWFIIGTVLDLYNLARAASTSAIIANAGSAALATTLIYLAIPWLTPPILRRSYAFGLVALATASIVAWRVFYAKALVHPVFRQHGLVVGSPSADLDLALAIQQAGQNQEGNPYKGTGYEIIGRVAEEGGDDGPSGIPLLGDMRKLVRLARQSNVDEIILTQGAERTLSREGREVLLDCREVGLQISSLASVYERLTGRLPVDHATYDVQLLLSAVDNPSVRLYRATKRAMDVVLALVGLVALGLVLPFVALANALWSRGPLFYYQQRIGKGGRPFTVIKLRSMIVDAERCSGAVWCGKGDPRITRIGHLLRKSRLDELPQAINVLKGEMSIVGPRPERPHFVGRLARDLPLYRARHAVKPGLTGWAQVHLEYGDSAEDARAKLEYDLYYVKHACLYLDLLTMLHTVRVVIGLKGQ
mgnify:CR=1 FL=1